MALGAQPANVVRLVIGQGMKLVLLGLAVGVLGGYVLTRLLTGTAWQAEMANLLYGVKGTDPMTLAVITILLALIALTLFDPGGDDPDDRHGRHDAPSSRQRSPAPDVRTAAARDARRRQHRRW